MKEEMKSKSKITLWQLQQKQSLSLDIKIKLTRRRIEEFYKAFEGKVYVAYSGGKDSEVLLHLVRRFCKDVKAVFVDTGTELDTRRHAIKKADVILKPKIPMLQVWKKYGVPFPSKQQAHFIYQVKHTKSDYLRNRLMTGFMKDGSKTRFKVAEKWKFIIATDIEVSDKCCYYLKKEPFQRYNKETGEVPIIGTMASDSMERKKGYLKNGCINFEKKVCIPLGFWTEQDILLYIKKYKLDYCKAYGDIITSKGKLKTTKADRTGCVGCGFGVQMEKEPNRFQRMSEENPRMHNVIMNKWCNGNMGKLMKQANINTKMPKRISEYE